MFTDPMFMQGYKQGGIVWVKTILAIQHLIWQQYMDSRPRGGGGAGGGFQLIFYESNETEIDWKTE